MHFLFIIYEGAQLKINDLRFKRLHRYLFQNIVELTDINDEDIDYLIDFWSDQEIKDKKIRKVIKEVGEGYPQLIKSCCLALNVKGQNYSNPDELKEFFINHPNIQRIKLRLSGHGITKYDSLTGNMYINGVNAIDVLTKIESEIVIQLFQASSVGLSKEDIAEIMWKEDENINYSDSAISQQIYRLRTKLENMGLDRDIIKTVPKKGYVWNEV
jgi:hypothetical protein